jgi:hypothetical protein
MLGQTRHEAAIPSSHVREPSARRNPGAARAISAVGGAGVAGGCGAAPRGVAQNKPRSRSSRRRAARPRAPAAPEALLGRQVLREFEQGPFLGTITAARVFDDGFPTQWHLSYDDGDAEDLDWRQLCAYGLLPDMRVADADPAPPPQEAPLQQRGASASQLAGGGAAGAARAVGVAGRYKGVSRESKGEAWLCNIYMPARRHINNGLVHIGRFADEKVAALTYDAVAREHGLPVNFPRPGEVQAVRGNGHAAAAPGERRERSCPHGIAASDTQSPLALPAASKRTRERASEAPTRVAKSPRVQPAPAGAAATLRSASSVEHGDAHGAAAPAAAAPVAAAENDGAAMQPEEEPAGDDVTAAAAPPPAAPAVPEPSPAVHAPPPAAPAPAPPAAAENSKLAAIAAFLRGIQPPLEQLDAALAALPGSGVTMARLASFAASSERAMLVDSAAASLRLELPFDRLAVLHALLALPPGAEQA